MADTATPALDRSLVRGIAWTGGVRWLTQLVSWGATLVVARILTPADYGLVGMALIAVGIAQLVGEAGLVAALVLPTWMKAGRRSWAAWRYSRPPPPARSQPRSPDRSPCFSGRPACTPW